MYNKQIYFKVLTLLEGACQSLGAQTRVLAVGKLGRNTNITTVMTNRAHTQVNFYKINERDQHLCVYRHKQRFNIPCSNRGLCCFIFILDI